MKTKRKTVLKAIRKWVDALPAETYKAYHKYYQPQWEEDDSGKEVLRFGYLEDHNVNHYRRCKKAYDDFGMLGVQSYLYMYGFQLSNQQNLL